MKRCCVVIPYFNDGHRLTSTLKSLQSERSLVDVLVVDDGSRELPAREVVDGDLRWNSVELLELPENRGIEHALNAGIEHARDQYEFIGRLDCGDESEPTRFAKQMSFLDSHPDCAVVGAWVKFVDMQGTYLYTLRQPAAHAQILRQMRVNCAFTHPAVTLRSSLLARIGPYPVDRKAAEDYALLFQLVKDHDGANLQEALVTCLINPAGISSARRKVQLRSRMAIMWTHFDWSPLAVYGIVRAALLLYTPRRVTVVLNRMREKMRSGRRLSSRRESSFDQIGQE